MAGITLYPPVVNSWMPAFVQTDPVRVYFSLSKYNNISEVKYVQITCSSQLTNLTILHKKNYPIGIKMISADAIGYDAGRSGDDKWYITISPDDLQEPAIIDGVKGFQINQYFKVQMRFASSDIPPEEDWDGSPTTLNNWTIAHLDKLSEWSRVCVIKAISQPSISLQGWSEPLTEIDTSFFGITGALVFRAGSAEKEVLESYTLIIKDQLGMNILYQSEKIFSDGENPNEIYYSIPYMLTDDAYYQLVIIYTTNNGYTNDEGQILHFHTQFHTDTELLARLYTIPDEENSCIVVRLVPEYAEGTLFVDYNEALEDAYVIYQDQLNYLNVAAGGVQNYITILRSSDKDNFTLWEDIHTEYLDSYEHINYVYLDYTAEGGVLYKYAVQKRNIEGGRSPALYEMKEEGGVLVPADPKVYAPESVFLITKDVQLNVKFNEDINSIKHVIAENSTETIGSKYPFIRRNGNINYRQFNIQGLISTLVDWEKGETWNVEEMAFNDNVYEAKKKAFYGDNYQYYQKYNIDNNIDLQNDIIYEKKYRQKVEAFLMDGQPKLFKSTPEGNIIVRLTDVSLTPEKQLGRMLYSFQAKATEIADDTIANYEKYNIIDKINYFGGVV